jgi:3-hydroxyacyl-CoA dehydrogenase
MTELSESVSIEVDGNVAVIVVDNPPVNALSHHVRAGLAAAVAAVDEGDAEAAVLICTGRTFIAGADISEFGGPPKRPGLHTVQEAMENCTKPVVAAIHGTALGGGLEVALCAHFRVSDTAARFGLPEVKLGLLPGAGGTQRLPRITGAAKAAQMVTTGEQIDSAEALACGLVDEVVDDLRGGAIAFARRVLDEQRPLTRIRDRSDMLEGTDPALFDQVRAGMARRTRGFLAPELNLQCIEAAVNLSFDEGLAREGELFQKLSTGVQSKAQQYYFFAERAANKIPDVPRDTPTIDIRSAGVLGAGTMGGGIAMNFANAGIPVTMVERDQAALDSGLNVIRGNYERTASKGRISQADVEARMALITPSLDKAAFGQADIVIEAVFENMDLKKSIFAELDEICRPGAVLASNTSALDINEIASATSRPESVIGMHFFSPANVMKLLEIVRGDATGRSVIATAMAVAKQIGKVPVLVGVSDGFVGNRMLAQRRVEANRIILEGATPAQVDKVLFDFGFPMGPFSMSDLAGLDIGWDEATSTGTTLRDRMCESGRRGQKNGRGYYTYDPETRAATPDPEVVEIIREYATEQGVEQREVTDQEVLERCLYPMVNEGAKIIEEGITIRGSDVDVVWINGYGWPVYTGGPMFWADTVGLSEVVDAIGRYHAERGGRHWEPSPLLTRLAGAGGLLQQATA